jgi:pre-rRNA-processing protein TSR3
MMAIMQPFPPTFVLRHRRENLKKCSLRGLEPRPDFRFFTYPTSQLPDLRGYILLALDGPPLTAADSSKGLFLLDATWRHAVKMRQYVDRQVAGQGVELEIRSIPAGYRTAYPRRQDDCPDPEEGLASVEALYIAYRILGRDTATLLDTYHWKEEFLEKNQFC